MGGARVYAAPRNGARDKSVGSRGPERPLRAVRAGPNPVGSARRRAARTPTGLKSFSADLAFL